MSQSIKCLPHKYEDLSLDPQPPCENLNMYDAITCKPSTGEAELVRSMELADQLALSNQQVPGSPKWETLS